MLLQAEEPVELQFSNQASAILPASSGNNDNTKISKRKVMKNIVNKRKKNKKSSNYNPLLPESTELSDDDNDDNKDIEINVSSKPSTKHPFTLITKTSKTKETPPSKLFNIYCMLLVSNAFLIGSFLLFIHDYIVDGIGIIMIIVGLGLNAYTIWKFCGQRICPMLFKHENKFRLQLF